MESIPIKNSSQPPLQPASTSGRMKKVSCEMDEFLLTKLRNIIAGEKASGLYRYGSVNEIIRASLQSFQKQPQITIVRQLGNPRTPYTFVLPLPLWELYHSWPLRQRTAQLENILLTYLNQI